MMYSLERNIAHNASKLLKYKPSRFAVDRERKGHTMGLLKVGFLVCDRDISLS